MKPKLNILTQQYTCDQPIFEDFENLKTCSLTPNIDVFDATQFCIDEKIEEPSYATFYLSCQRYINPKLNELNLKSSDLFYQNKDGHTLIHVGICLIYMRFVSEQAAAYFENIVASCLLTGMAMSDAAVIGMAANRLPDNVLQEIITTRSKNESE